MMSSIDIGNFEKIREKGEVLYQTFGKVYCPYFKEKISFSSSGLNHIKFKRVEMARPPVDQRMRFKLLYLAPEVIARSHTLQGECVISKFERVRKNNRSDKVLSLVTFYEFIAVMGRNRVKVIIKQIESGEKFFWSLIPFWGTDAASGRRILADGMID